MILYNSGQVCLPVFIALSPINPCDAASELDVHRLAQYELAGNLHGSKQAALTMEARGPNAAHVLRKIVVAKLKGETVLKDYHHLAHF